MGLHKSGTALHQGSKNTYVITINKFGALSWDWVGGKNMFVCFGGRKIHKQVPRMKIQFMGFFLRWIFHRQHRFMGNALNSEKHLIFANGLANQPFLSEICRRGHWKRGICIKQSEIDFRIHDKCATMLRTLPVMHETKYWQVCGTLSPNLRNPPPPRRTPPFLGFPILVCGHDYQGQSLAVWILAVKSSLILI